MSPALHWIIGAGGLLGSAVAARVGRSGGDMFAAGPIGWGADPVADLSRAADRFHREADGRDWRVYWCAGASVTASDPRALEAEFQVFSRFLQILARASERPGSGLGGFFLASSAGAVYGGAPRPPHTEHTLPAPLGAYGEAKLRAESMVGQWGERTGVATAIGRIANLYGPGQRLGKAQGLVSHLCLAAVTRRPMQIYVPLDTRRDYIFADDGAAMAVDLLERTVDGGPTTKILGSGTSTSVGALIGAVRRASAVAPPFVMSASPHAQLQGMDLRLRSRVHTDLDERSKVSLDDGISRCMRAVRVRFAAGEIAHPAVR